MRFVCGIGAWTSASIGFEFGYREDAKLWQPYFQLHFVAWTFTVGWINEYEIEFITDEEG